MTTTKAQGEGALHPGLACHLASWGYRLPTTRSRCSPGTACKQTRTALLLACAQVGRAGHVCAPGPFPALVHCCSGARGRLWGWVGLGLMEQQGEAGSPGMAIYKPAFSFGRLPSSSPPSAGRKKAPLSRRQMGRGRALAHTMGWIMCWAGGGLAAGRPGRAAAASTLTATPQHGLGSRPRSFVTPANTTALAPRLPRGTERRNTPALRCMSPSFSGSLQCH